MIYSSESLYDYAQEGMNNGVHIQNLEGRLKQKNKAGWQF